MVKSRTHGEPSLRRSLLAVEDSTRLLSAIAHSKTITPVKKALGSETPLFLVGGLVRDAMFGDEPLDIDATTPLPVEEALLRCRSAGLRTVETGVRHGTILVVVDDVHVEITSFRKPSDRNNHILAGSIEEDLSGRDFTINAIAFDITTGRLVDPFSGIDDLRNGQLRAVGNPEHRFREDPLRLLRMVRFGAASSRSVDPATYSAAARLAPLLATVSPERIKSELDKVLMLDGPSGFRQMLDLGLLPYTVPELLPAVGFQQNEFHIHDVFEHTLWVLERCPPDLTLRWSAVFHDVGKPHTLSTDEAGRRHFYKHENVSEVQSLERMDALRFSNDDRKSISTIVRHHMRPVDCGPSGVRRILRDLGEDFERWYLFKFADATPILPQEQVDEAMRRFRILVDEEIERKRRSNEDRLVIDGHDIMALGIPAGPRLGRILAGLQELVIENPQNNTRENLLRKAAEINATLN